MNGNQTLDDCFDVCGWQKDGLTEQWTHESSHGPATLRHLGDSGDWRQFSIEGGAVPKPSDAEILGANYGLYGPTKFVAQPNQAPICRADLPKEFALMSCNQPASFDVADFDSLSNHNPYQTWAAAVTACATGEIDGPALPPASEALVELLKHAGWSASLDDGEVHVHIHMPGLFRQARVEPQEEPGVKIIADLMPLEGVTGASYDAAIRLANTANDRLPLVRFAVAGGEDSQVVRAEVHIGCATISGGWFTTSLDVVEAAITLTARELLALRDRELGELVLAVTAAL